MKMMKKFGALLLALTVLLTLAACGTAGSGEKDYQVKVVDATGEPYTAGVIVKFMQNGQQIAMQVVDGNGVAAKTLPAGTYNIELMFTDTDRQYAYDNTGLELTADKTQLDITLAYALGDKTMEIFVQKQSGNTVGTFVTTGSTQVPVKAGVRSYYLFAPTEQGTYEVSVVGNVKALGCYGTAYYVQENSIYEVVDNCFTMSISKDEVGAGDGSANIMAIGLDGESDGSCTLSIKRIGNAAWTIEDDPWDVYKTTASLSKYTLPEGARVEAFDLTKETSAYNLVYNETDGFYHLDSENGPLVLVFLGKDTKYLACFKTQMERTGVKKYFFNEDGSLEKKEDYGECLYEYYEYMDEKEGVYPLTKDLEYIIKNRGEAAGWWELGSNTSVFMDDEGNPVPGINAEIAWLLMCGYIAQ